MRKVILDIINHTHGLGFISEIKITGDDSSTRIDGMDEHGRVVINGTLKEPLADFSGEFGIGKMGQLRGLAEFSNFKTDKAVVRIETKERNGVTQPDRAEFVDEQGQVFKHRFMSADAIESYEFVGEDWDVEFVPSKSKIGELTYMSRLYGDDDSFEVKTENGELRFYIGEDGGGFLIMETDVAADFKDSYRWPINEVLKVIKLDEGKAKVSIHDDVQVGSLQVAITSEYADWIYVFPKLS